MHLADFFGHAAVQGSQLQHKLAALPQFPPAARHCLLTGPERSGKTTLLFQAALSAARQGQDVLLLCRRKKLEQVPPLLPEGVHVSNAAWQRVRIKYVANGAELLRYVSLVHALPGGPPDLLAVDDLHALADLPAGDRPRPRDMVLCRILAALHEAADVASQLKGRPCRLLVSDTSHTDGPRLLYILQRWLPLVLRIQPGDHANSLGVLNPAADMPPGCLAQLRFSVASGSLALEGIA